MSSNSFSRILQTAPIVSALRGRESRWRTCCCCCSETATLRSLLLQVAQLVLADLDLVAVGEPVRLDPAPVDVGAVERDEVVAVEAVSPVDQLGPQDVDLAVQDPAFVGDLVLLGGELVDQVFQLFVAERTEIGKGVLHRAPWSGGLRLRWPLRWIIGR